MTDTKAITASVWAARGPSLWTRKDPNKSTHQQAAERAWEDGSRHIRSRKTWAHI